MDVYVLKCPCCGADMKDWRNYAEKDGVDRIKLFECTGFRCSKRWAENELEPKPKGSE